MCLSSFISTNMIIRLIVFFAAFNYFIIAEPFLKPCHPDDSINNSTVFDYAHCNLTFAACAVHRGANLTMTVSFVPEYILKRISNVLYVEYQGVRFNHPEVHGTDACDSIYTFPHKIKQGCPLEPGKRYIYQRTNYINSTLPKIPKVVVHWAIRDRDMKKDVLCYDITVKVV